MREILYDMIHNSMWGTISLSAGGFSFFYCAFFIGLCYVWKCYHERHDLSRLKKFLLKKGAIRKIYFVILWAALVICIVTFVLFIFMDWRVEHRDYKYIQTDMAKQKNLDILFLDEVQIEVNENEDMRKLHITIDSPITEITEEEIKKRIDIFATIYQVGEKTPDADNKMDSDTGEDGQETELQISGKKSEMFVKYQKEYEDWSTSFANSGLPSDLYQSGRAARDMLEVGRSECDDEELLKIAAEAVYRSERFLEYDNRNINTEEAPIIIEAKDILFENGKVFYQLYLETETREELKAYRKELIVNTYVCMFLAEEEVTESDTEYAKVNYYIGNTRERMLSEISTEAPFYEVVRQDALEHYETALRCLENRPDYYDKESNMEENCRKGIDTLNNS